jgi:translocation protein SEC63
MSAEYSYDEQGQFFPFFILTVTGLVTLPITWTLLSPSKAGSAAAQAARIKTDFKAEHADQVDSLRAAQKRKHWRVKRTLFAVGGWALMALMVYLIVNTQRVEAKIWNPFDILGIPESATEQEIKKRHRTLSLKYHPDKVKPDASKNETVESLNTHYVEISKAYQALTDEDVRSNYLQYGHPDGRQGFSIGIALPQFIVADGNGKYVVMLYTFLLGVMLPYLVGSWWYGTRRMSKDGILMESANRMFMEYDANLDTTGVIEVLSIGQEFEETLKKDKAKTDEQINKIEARLIREGSPFTDGALAKAQEKLTDLGSGIRRKALGLIWAYLGRVELEDAALNKAKFEVAPVARSLIKAFHTISLAYGNTAPVMSALHAAQHLVQAMLPKSSPLLQLPHMTPEIARIVDGDTKIHVSVQQLMELPDTQRKHLLVQKGSLSESQYDDIVGVAKQLPLLRVAKAFFKVTGERFITPSSLITLVVKGRFIPPGTENIPEVNESDLEDVDPAEDDVEAITGRKKKVFRKGADGKPVAVVEELTSPPLAFAPRFARDHAPSWSVFLTDSKQGKIAVPPFTFSQFENPSFDENGKPTFAVQTLKAQFAAPPQPGRFTFVMHVVCDSYVGFDTKMEVTLVVEQASKAAQIAAEDEISDPEEDSLAGQMTALKGGDVKRRPNGETEDESGTDVAEADTSATNTDTEDES